MNLKLPCGRSATGARAALSHALPIFMSCKLGPRVLPLPRRWSLTGLAVPYSGFNAWFGGSRLTSRTCTSPFFPLPQWVDECVVEDIVLVLDFPPLVSLRVHGRPSDQRDRPTSGLRPRELLSVLRALVPSPALCFFVSPCRKSSPRDMTVSGPSELDFTEV